MWNLTLGPKYIQFKVHDNSSKCMNYNDNRVQLHCYNNADTEYRLLLQLFIADIPFPNKSTQRVHIPRW